MPFTGCKNGVFTFNVHSLPLASVINHPSLSRLRTLCGAGIPLCSKRIIKSNCRKLWNPGGEEYIKRLMVKARTLCVLGSGKEEFSPLTSFPIPNHICFYFLQRRTDYGGQRIWISLSYSDLKMKRFNLEVRIWLWFPFIFVCLFCYYFFFSVWLPRKMEEDEEKFCS